MKIVATMLIITYILNINIPSSSAASKEDECGNICQRRVQTCIHSTFCSSNTLLCLKRMEECTKYGRTCFYKCLDGIIA